MRTLLATLLGVFLAYVFTTAVAAMNRRRTGAPVEGAMLFMWLWLAATIIDGYVGVAAGHALGLEIIVHAIIFVVPTALARLLWRRRGAPGQLVITLHTLERIAGGTLASAIRIL